MIQNRTIKSVFDYKQLAKSPARSQQEQKPSPVVADCCSDCSISIQGAQAEACCFGGNPDNRDMVWSIHATPAGLFLSCLCFQKAIWQHRVSHYNASAPMKRNISDRHFEFLKGRFKNMDWEFKVQKYNIIQVCTYFGVGSFIIITSFLLICFCTIYHLIHYQSSIWCIV